jgi:hypothetical protein
MQQTPSPHTTPRTAPPEALRAAFRDLHGQRLHGFALLATLGDRSLAARLSADALAASARQADELRHPERAAAWLRAHVVRSLPRRHRTPSPAERRAGLEPMGIEAAAVIALAVLGRRERAALVASDVERLDRHDVETIVGRRGGDLDRLLARARRDYAAAYADVPGARAGAGGPIESRVAALAARTMQ